MSNTRHRHKDDTPAPEAGMSADAINIPDNVLMHGMQGYSASDQEDLLWLFGWATDEGLSRSRLCELLESDWSTVIRVALPKSFVARASSSG